MAFFQSLVEFIETVFLSSNPDVKMKLDIRKLENDLKMIKPEIYKNGQLTENFGNAFFVLYKETAFIQEILQSTINSDNVQVAHHYMDLLISTGFTGDYKQKIDKFEEKVDTVEDFVSDKWDMIQNFNPFS